MALGKHTLRWERYGITALVGAIGLGLFYTVFAVLNRPHRVDEDELEEAAEAAVTDVQIADDAPEPAVRSRESRRFYRRPLAVHDMEYAGAPAAGRDDRAGDYGVLVPSVSAPSASPAFSAAFDFPPPPAPRGPTRKKDEDEDDKDKQSTGWGWLADDIAAGRAQRESQARTETPEEEDDRDAPMRQEARGALNERRTDPPVLFMDTAFVPNNPDQMAMRSPLREEGDGSSRTGDRADRDPTRRDPAVESAGFDQDARSVNPALGMRDPFAPASVSERSRPGEAGWDFGSGRDSFTRDNPALFTPGREASGGATPGARWGDPRVRESSVGLSSAAPSFGSDAFFNSGGGYAPLGGGGARSDGLFSGGESFGSAGRFVPAGGGISPIGGGIGASSGGSLPAPGASYGGSRWGSEPASPRALPW
ncbi:MAG TPA: hypothetical protein PKE26_14585 [Kiritimatiellia bacterium]|nr:hypothetical protein [Kiritimatiellia bacterium]HMP00327.1 hypothetical protein [Kiritimatiellia bacterium]HMP97560.1 hypothetical protein [Kiritimatiellia bacterium]